MNSSNRGTRRSSSTTSTPSLQAVIFDVDGTLAETEREGHRIAFNQAFADFDLDWDWTPELYGELLSVTGGKERVRLYIQTYAQEHLARTDLDLWIARLYKRKSELYAERVHSGAITLRAGVARLIDELRRAGIRLAIATTTAPSNIHALISANLRKDMLELFEVIGAGDLLISKKPAPDVYQWVMQRLGLPAEACLAIEDSSIGLTAARAAGLPTIVTVSSYTADENFDGALSVLSGLGETDAPARVIDGLPLSGPCVDVAQLREWHHQALNAARSPDAAQRA
jgi:HAD superfamily hydrolase (TIGR01509 family)